MYRYLILLMAAVTLSKLGIQLSSLDCPSRACAQEIEKASRQVLSIEWRPISVFPKESKRFQ